MTISIGIARRTARRRQEQDEDFYDVAAQTFVNSAAEESPLIRPRFRSQLFVRGGEHTGFLAIANSQPPAVTRGTHELLRPLRRVEDQEDLARSTSDALRAGYDVRTPTRARGRRRFRRARTRPARMTLPNERLRARGVRWSRRRARHRVPRRTSAERRASASDSRARILAKPPTRALTAAFARSLSEPDKESSNSSRCASRRLRRTPQQHPRHPRTCQSLPSATAASRSVAAG